MSRNLLPDLAATNIPQGTPGQWKRLAAPQGLLQLDFGDVDDSAVRRRIQSIPSPWARMLLFKHALQDERHPARFMVETELLDAFEYLWARSALALANLEFDRLPMSSILELARHAGSARAEGFARAVVELQSEDAGAFEFVIVRSEGHPVLASSPYTGLFTAEDAADHVPGRYFRFTQAGEFRPLESRPPGFRKYMATVVLPQLQSSGGIAGMPRGQSAALRQILGGWLTRKVAEAGLGGSANGSYNAAAASLKLELIDTDFGGLVLFQQGRYVTPVQDSPWAVQSRHVFERPPLVLESQEFDGTYFEGANEVTLPPNLAEQPRDVLPGIGIRYPWVLPQQDWLSAQVLLFNEPLEREHLIGPIAYAWAGEPGNAEFGALRMTLPLSAEFFRYFDPADVEGMLTINASPPGKVEVKLRVPVGDNGRSVLVRRTYTSSEIVRGGPELAAWPRFASPSWKHNVVFRLDSTPATAANFELGAFSSGGSPIGGTVVQRTPLVHTYALSAAPEILEFRSRLTGGRSLGTLLPKFEVPDPLTGQKWSVGIDFGTSNTVVSIRGEGGQKPSIFGTSDFTLALTRQGESTAAHLDAYFLPHDLPSRPFGTALVYLKALPGTSLDAEPIAARLTVPFHGHVYRDPHNAVAGDLKWSAEPQAYFRSVAYLRHVVAVILAEALRRGIAPEEVRFAWAYPRAFTPTQRRRLQSQWEQVLKSFSDLGVSEASIETSLDESRAGLRHFFNAGLVSMAGTSTAILDIGGGTTDIAAYGSGRVIAYDSVMLGGRNLTGPRLQSVGSDIDELNPFVARLVNWAEENGLPDLEQEFVRAYLDSNQLHLAFSYLIQTQWFKDSPQASLFQATPAYEHFQRVVLYFFAGLFYYLGLSFRDPDDLRAEVPRTVVLAGNGSRYIHWLTGQRPDNERSVFRALLGRMALRAAGSEEGDPPRIIVSEKPKEEVARGLVESVPPGERVTEQTTMTPVVGEAIRIGQPPRQFGAAERFAADDLLSAEAISRLQWSEGELEIERFHAALIAEAPSVAPEGGAWQHAAKAYREWTNVQRSELQSGIASRMLYIAQAEDGFAGSVFIAGLAEMIERMLQRLR